VDQKLLNESEVSELLGVSVHAVRTWRLQKKPPQFLKIGRRVLYRPQDINNFIETCVQDFSEKKGKKK
jgi:predicted DNA-binding transcriptional regulator AlpA